MAQVELLKLSMANVTYPEMYNQVAREFEKLHPDISVEVRNNPGPSYDPLTQ